MPYIDQNQRAIIDESIDTLITAITRDVEVDDVRNFDGVLNYTITRLIQATLGLVSSPRYTKFNTALGILEGVKLELYRRRVGPYEDVKIEENGDV